MHEPRLEVCQLNKTKDHEESSEICKQIPNFMQLSFYFPKENYLSCYVYTTLLY